MISKRDYFEYFQQVLAIEIQMEQTYRQMISSLTNTEYIKVFQGLMEAEQDHQAKARKIMKYFEK